MKVEKGHNVKVHYKGTFVDGTEFDNSYDREQTLDFQVGSNNLLDAFNDALLGMTKGQTKTISVKAEDAYGTHDPEAVAVVPRTAFPPEYEFAEGMQVQGADPEGRMVLAKILTVEEENITLDVNHPLAGKDLNFEVELVEIEETESD